MGLAEGAQCRNAVLFATEVRGETSPPEQGGVEGAEASEVDPLAAGDRADVRQFLVGSPVDKRSLSAPGGEALHERGGRLECNDLVAALKQRRNLSATSRSTDEHTGGRRREDIARSASSQGNNEASKQNNCHAEGIVQTVDDVIDAIERRVGEEPCQEV